MKTASLSNSVTFGKNSQRIYSEVDSNRSEDGNRFLTITDCVLTSEAVNDYSGSQIAEEYRTKYNLQLDKKYPIYRPLEEIEKAKDTFNLRPLTDDHIAITPELPAQTSWLGTSGESGRIEGGDLLNTVAVWTGKGKQYIEDADNGKESGKKDLSCGYAYELVKEPGIFNGQPYEFKMINLRGNHVALVKVGRVDGAMIADSNNIKGVHTVKKKSGMRIFMDHFFSDSKGKDSAEEKRKMNDSIMKSMKEISGKDASEFEGGEAEKGKTIMDMASKINDMDEPEDDVYDSEEEKIKGKDKAKDSKDCPAKDEDEPEPKEPEASKAIKKVDADNKAATPNKKAEDSKMMDSADVEKIVNRVVEERIQTRNKVINLCTDVVGRLSNELMMDSNLENIVDETLRLKGVNYQNKPLETKLAMLEVFKGQSKSGPMFTDSGRNINTSKASNPSIFAAMKGK